jgi:NAD(P)-dependent dehydrogenase (short-subunit alcohol dehydrogenase family)
MAPASEFGGRTVLVTGGTAGIGLATARRFASEGANVVVAARDAARGARVAAELGDSVGTGGAVRFVAADLRDASAPARIVAATVEAFGGLDFAVNNAAADIRLARAVDIAAVVRRLCSAESRHVVGHALVADGGLTA